LHLGSFVTCQRTLNRSGTLSAERRDKLVKLGFDFEPEYTRTSWEVRFQQLEDFYKEYGHFDVLDTNKALQQWVTIQRNQYRLKCKRLTGCRLQKLQAIGFEWESRRTTSDEGSKIRPSQKEEDAALWKLYMG
jgi:hypothetical protein